MSTPNGWRRMKGETGQRCPTPPSFILHPPSLIQIESGPAYKPGSVEALRLRTIISLGVRSPAHSSSQPAASSSLRTATRRLFGLAPAGVCHAVRITAYAVGSYPTFSPLPPLARRRFVFCGTVRHTLSCVPRRYLAACPRSPDFPRRINSLRRDRPAGPLVQSSALAAARR